MQIPAQLRRTAVQIDQFAPTWAVGDLSSVRLGEGPGGVSGRWWSPDGDALLVVRVDEPAVQRWHIADPAYRDRVPTEVAYPAAGTVAWARTSG